MDYSFLYSEVWWMDSIVGAIVSAVATLIGAAIFYNYKIGKLIDTVNDNKNNLAKLPEQHNNLSKEHSGLSKEHSGLSKEHSGLSKEHSKLENQSALLSAQQREIYENVRKIADKAILEEERSKTFNQNQKDMQAAINTVNNFWSSYHSLKTDLDREKEKNLNLTQEVALLKNKVYNLDLTKEPKSKGFDIDF